MSDFVKVGLLQDLQPGAKGLKFRVPNQEGSLPAFAIRHGEAETAVAAYLNHCPHLGVELDWNPGDFFDRKAEYLVCSLHGAIFAPDNGRCVAGPCAGARLSALETKVENGWVYAKQLNKGVM